MVQKKTTQKTARKTGQKTAQGVVHGVVYRVGSTALVAGNWLWDHRKPILTNVAWLGLGTIIGAVRVIPPPAKFIKLGLFRIGTG